MAGTLPSFYGHPWQLGGSNWRRPHRLKPVTHKFSVRHGVDRSDIVDLVVITHFGALITPKRAAFVMISGDQARSFGDHEDAWVVFSDYVRLHCRVVPG